MIIKNNIKAEKKIIKIVLFINYLVLFLRVLVISSGYFIVFTFLANQIFSVPSSFHLSCTFQFLMDAFLKLTHNLNYNDIKNHLKVIDKNNYYSII